MNGVSNVQLWSTRSVCLPRIRTSSTHAPRCRFTMTGQIVSLRPFRFSVKTSQHPSAVSTLAFRNRQSMFDLMLCSRQCQHRNWKTGIGNIIYQCSGRRDVFAVRYDGVMLAASPDELVITGGAGCASFGKRAVAQLAVDDI